MKTQKERMLSGELYQASDPELRNLAQKARKLMRLFNSTTEEEVPYRTTLLKELLGKTGENIYIEPSLKVDYGINITVGENFYANYDCIILDVCPVVIGDNVMFGPRVSILTPSHPIDAEIRISGIENGAPITIGDNVWVGGGAIINPGVTIGDNCIIGSGAVVTKDVPSNTIAAGNPCRVIRDITEADKKYWENQAKEYWESVN